MPNGNNNAARPDMANNADGAVNPEVNDAGQQENGLNRFNYAKNASNPSFDRSKLARIFIFGFFAILILCFVFARYDSEHISELKELLTSAGGLMTGLIGFIFGYYFKNDTE